MKAKITFTVSVERTRSFWVARFVERLRRIRILILEKWSNLQ